VLFISLYKDGVLRGCYGIIRPHHYLASAISYYAKSATKSFYWLGFIKEEEIDDLEVQDSIVDNVRKIKTFEELTPEIDGLHVETVIKQHDFLPRMWKRYTDKKHFFQTIC